MNKKINGKKIIPGLIILTILLLPFSVLKAADGSGVNSVSTSSTHIAVSDTGNQLTFTFTAAESMDSGAINITAPTGWSAPQGSSGTVGYTTSTASGTLGKVENSMDSITSPLWQGSASTTVSLETTVKKEGSGSVKIAFDATAIAGETAYVTTTAQDWSNYTKIGIWVYSSATQAATGDLQFGIATTTDFSGAAFIDIATTTVNTWTYHVLDISGVPASTLSAVQSYGIKYAVDYFSTATGYVYLDEALIGPDNVNALSFSSQTVTARILQLPTSGTITLTYGAGGGTSGATAPSTAQSYTFTTQSKTAVDGTLTDITTSPYVLVHPTAITDLSAVAGERAGVVALSWTAPSGSPTGYVVKYYTSAINSGSVWSASTAFSQSWAGTATSGYVTGLAAGATYYFAVEATGADSTQASLSNSPSAIAGYLGTIDNIPPSTTIEAPLAGEMITAGKDYAIKGTSLDTGGSSVGSVSISLDGGTIWNEVTPLVSTDSGYSWQYIWTSPEVGDYTIQAKAKDWSGNIEAPGTEVSVTVVAEEATSTEQPAQPEEKVAEEKQAETPASITIEEVKAKIIEVQAQIVALLQQLIQLIQSQISVLHK